MKIAQVAPLNEAVPPLKYGGSERVVSYLTEELVKRGHDVTLFANGDSRTTAKLLPMCNRSLGVDGQCGDPVAHLIGAFYEVIKRAHEFDIIHFHVPWIHLPLCVQLPVPNVTTIHNRTDSPDLQQLFRRYSKVPLVGLSDSHVSSYRKANWVGIVPNGIPAESYSFGRGDGGYLAFLGRICPIKGIERAIEIAIAAKVPLKIAARINKRDENYFEGVIKPWLDHPLIEYIGEVNDNQKESFLQHARALLFPINWPEPFGMVMTESLACGTPVIGWNNGSVPEVIDHEQTGFVINSIEEGVSAVHKLGLIQRAHCREVFLSRFTVPPMVDRYEHVYSRLLSKEWKPIISRANTVRVKKVKSSHPSVQKTSQFMRMKGVFFKNSMRNKPEETLN